MAHLRDIDIDESPALRPYRWALQRLVPGWAAHGVDRPPVPVVDPPPSSAKVSCGCCG